VNDVQMPRPDNEDHVRVSGRVRLETKEDKQNLAALRQNAQMALPGITNVHCSLKGELNRVPFER